jgi:hypothetical protein
MSRITALLVGVAALAVISTVAEAADGCGRGWYYNGRRCVPQDEPGYYRPEYRGGYEDRGSGIRLDLGGRRDEGRYSPPAVLRRLSLAASPRFSGTQGGELT